LTKIAAASAMRAIAGLIEHCDRRGFLRPLIVITAAKDGTIVAYRLGAANAVDDLAHHPARTDGNPIFPIHLLVLDQAGHSLHADLDARGEVKIH
jgi:hypothetical protein